MSPYHNNPNPFAHFLYGFEVQRPGKMRMPGMLEDPFEEEELSMSDKIDLILERMERVEKALLPKEESQEENPFAAIMSRLA